MSVAWLDNEALGIRDVRRDLVCPSIALLQSDSVVFRKPTDTQSISKLLLNSITYTIVNPKH